MSQTIEVVQNKTSLSPYLQFNREDWRQFRYDTPLTLSKDDLKNLHGQMEEVSLAEIEEVYLPLSRLLSLYVTATQSLHQASSAFLGKPTQSKVPYLIGVAGSVGVGKSTTSRILKALLSSWPHHPQVTVVTTDGFLYTNTKLEKMGLKNRKGFPESYHIQALLKLLYDLKSGKGNLQAPIYSHHHYDIMPNQFLQIDHPDIVIVEGLNILQIPPSHEEKKVCPSLFVSDFFDFTVYVDAETRIIEKWYIERVLKFCRSAFQDVNAHFHFLTKLTHEEQIQFAQRIWQEINGVNLRENILPYRERARLILRKSANHSVKKVLLRKL